MIWLGMQTGTSIQLGFHFSRRKMSTLVWMLSSGSCFHYYSNCQCTKKKGLKGKTYIKQNTETGDSEVLAPRFLMELEGKMDRQLSDYTNITLKLEVLQRPVISYQCSLDVSAGQRFGPRTAWPASLPRCASPYSWTSPGRAGS